MNKMQKISEEQLNAFVDDELGTREKHDIFTALNTDEELNDQVCEVRKLKSLVQHAYTDLPEPRREVPSKRSNYTILGKSAVAGLLLAIGAAAGWIGHGTPQQALSEPLNRQFSSFQNVEMQLAEKGDKNIILHLSTNDPFKLALALDETEKMLNQFKQAHKNIRVEIVANGDGLELLRANTSLFPQRTEELIKNFDNVTIMACANTLMWLDAQGVDTKLLPNINTTSSALEKVVERLKEGWLYIRV